MPGSKVIVHVGLMKAASTTIQRLAESSSELDLLDPTVIIDWQKETRRTKWRHGTQTFANVVSNTKLSSKPVLITYESLHTLHWFKFGREVAAALPDAEILLIARNPIDYIRSIYQKQIRSGYAGNLVDFARERVNQLRRTFDFDGMIAAYASCGLKTHLLPMELLQNESHEFFALLREILTVDLLKDRHLIHANSSPPFANLEMVRAANMLFSTILRDAGDGTQWSTYQRNVYSWTSRLSHITDESLRQLQSLFNVRNEADFKAEIGDLDQEFRAFFSQRMTCLRSRAPFAPYLKLYGIKP
jgi:hypothetical protein